MLGVLGVLVLCCMVAQAHTLTLTVTDSKTGSPVRDAGVYIDGAFTGRTDADGRFTYDHASSQDLRVKVSKAGYNSWADIISPTTSSVTVPLSRTLVTLTVEVFDKESVQPVADALVKVSGTDTSESMRTDGEGRADIVLPAMEDYTLEIQSPRYYTLLRSVSLGTTGSTVQYWLTRSDTLAVRVLDAETESPLPGAEVIADGVSRGETNANGLLSVNLVREETHTIRVEKTDYQTYTTERYLTTEDAVLTVPLSRETSPLTIAVFNEERIPIESATIYIDGEVAGKTDTYGRFPAGAVDAGVHRIGVSARGYADWSENRTISGQGEDLVAVLSYDTTECTIIVEDTDHRVVPDAAIIIDGEVRGHTDSSGRFTTTLTTHHTYNITADAPGYISTSTSVEIPQGIAEKTVSLTLSRNLSPVVIGGLAAVLLVAFVIVALVRRARRKRRSKPKKKRTNEL